LIGRLTGRIVEENADGTVVLDVSGVGYEVTVPLGTVGRASVDPSAPLTLFVHTHVREDALLLYGFATREDRAAFRVLIGISNIGPKIGTSILSALTTAELATIVARGETARLTAIPGVGKKTAERIVLELKDRLAQMAAAPAGAATPEIAPGDRLRDDLLSALQNLGYHRPLAEKAVDATLARADAPTFEQALRGALRELMR
jgi:holliday junction DNA helicase RuvA